MKKIACLCGCVFFLAWAIAGGQDQRPKKPSALITLSDLQCSFFAIASAPPMKIAASERGGEHIILGPGDVFYITRSRGDGLEEWRTLSVLEVGRPLDAYTGNKKSGMVAYKRGRAAIIKLDAQRAEARVETACGPIMIGNSLVPLRDREGILGVDAGYAGAVLREDAPSGKIVFMDNEFVQIAQGQWALIDQGTDHGLSFGQQLTVFHRADKKSPAEAIGNIIVIDAGQKTSTIKVLSAKEAIRLGDIVQVK